MEQQPSKPNQSLEYRGSFSLEVYDERSPGVRRKFTLHNDRLLIEGKEWLKPGFNVSSKLGNSGTSLTGAQE